MKKILKLALFLGFVAAFAATALTVTNNITSPIINEREVAKDRAGLETLVPGGQFTKEEVTGDFHGYIDAIYSAGDGNYIYKLKVNGYGGVGSITYLVLFDKEGTVTGYTVTQHGETKGYGSQVAENDFINRVIGLTKAEDLDTISGATISSTAVKDGLTDAFTHYELHYLLKD